MKIRPGAKIGLARRLRRDATEAEKRLWTALRNRDNAKYKFRRQHTLGPYVVDFVCLDKNLVIEIDGGQHADRVEYDARRTAALEAQGFRVVRFWNNDVVGNFDGVLQTIEKELKHPHPDPLPQAGEGEEANPSLPSPARGRGRDPRREPREGEGQP